MTEAYPQIVQGMCVYVDYLSSLATYLLEGERMASGWLCRFLEDCAVPTWATSPFDSKYLLQKCACEQQFLMAEDRQIPKWLIRREHTNHALDDGILTVRRYSWLCLSVAWSLRSYRYQGWRNDVRGGGRGDQTFQGAKVTPPETDVTGFGPLFFEKSLI